jgi:hypothetical protein
MLISLTRKLLLAFVLLFFLGGTLKAQELVTRKVKPVGQFNGLLRAGLCTSQIYNDDFGGYNKLGLTGGIGVFTRISQRFQFQIEMNYAMRGSRKRPNPKVGDFNTYSIAPHYLDIPLLIKTDINFFEVEFGLLSGFYLYHTERDQRGRIPQNQEVWQFNKYELALNLGINVPITEKWIANARFHYSILPASGQLGVVNGYSLTGGAYNNVITLSVHRLLIPNR